MATSDLLKGAPLFLQRRYSSLGPYVLSVIETEVDGIDPRDLSRDQIETIQLLAFIYTLHAFLEDSHRAVKATVATFSKLGVRKFNIGAAEFFEGSESVEISRRLGEALLESIPSEEIRKLLLGSDSLGELVKKLTSIVTDGRMDF
jgi:hypothetical protein